MSTSNIHFLSGVSVWSAVAAALRALPEPDRELGEMIADLVTSDSVNGMHKITLPDLDEDVSRRLARNVSLCVPQIFLRLSVRDDTGDVETVSLFYAGQRLAQRTIASPRRIGDLPAIVATETESRFTLRVVTDLPNRLDTLINELSVNHESSPSERPVFPIALVIPETEKSWGKMPGFNAAFTMILGHHGKSSTLLDSLACIRMPEPQSLAFLEAVARPAIAVFDLEFQVFGLPAGLIRDLFQARLGSWGKVYLIPSNESSVKPQRHIVATLSIPLGASANTNLDWIRLYQLAVETDILLEWPDDSDGPHAWADLPSSRFAQEPRIFGDSKAVQTIIRRVPLTELNPESSFADLIRLDAKQLPADACLEIAYAGTKTWVKRFVGNSGACDDVF